MGDMSIHSANLTGMSGLKRLRNKNLTSRGREAQVQTTWAVRKTGHGQCNAIREEGCCSFD